MNLHDKNKLFIYGTSDSTIQFSGALNHEMAAYGGRFRISCGGVVIHYYWNETMATWCSSIIQKSRRVSVDNCMVEPDDILQDHNLKFLISVVTVDFKIDVVKVESLKIGGKVDDTEYLLNIDVELNEHDAKMAALMCGFMLKNGTPLIDSSDENSIKGFVYFNNRYY